MLYHNQTESGELAYNIFGYKSDKAEFVRRLLSSSSRKSLETVAWRVYLIDALRYRSRFSQPSFFFSPDFSSRSELTWQLWEETKSLQLYLLCTCIDALASQEYITFDKWLKLRSASQKSIYKVDDQAISKLLKDVGKLEEPDIFRSAVAKIHDEVYLKAHGNRTTFVDQFTSMPLSIKGLLVNTYFISDKQNADPAKLEITEEGLGYPIWDSTYATWKSLDLETQIQQVGDYFYKYRRNPYTHKALSSRVLNGRQNQSDSSNDPFMQYISTEDIIEEKGKYKVIAFRSTKGEDEPLILRLAVTVAWLTKLGFLVNEEHLDQLRWYQMRRERIYAALDELEIIKDGLYFYSNANENRLGSLHLPLFPTIELTMVRTYLYILTPNEGAINQRLGNHIKFLESINSQISKYNKDYADSYTSKSQPDQLETIKIARAETYEVVSQMGELSMLKIQTPSLYSQLNHAADRMWIN